MVLISWRRQDKRAAGFFDKSVGEGLHPGGFHVCEIPLLRGVSAHVEQFQPGTRAETVPSQSGMGHEFPVADSDGGITLVLENQRAWRLRLIE